VKFYQGEFANDSIIKVQEVILIQTIILSLKIYDPASCPEAVLLVMCDPSMNEL
jgi:hypothetical protein